jgi:hypothetical protein
MEQTIALCFPLFEKMTYYQFSPIIAEFRVGPTGTGTGIAEGSLPYLLTSPCNASSPFARFYSIACVLSLYTASFRLSASTSVATASLVLYSSVLF